MSAQREAIAPDALGRETLKQCGCGRLLHRNTRFCPTCRHVFVGRQYEQRKSMREAGLSGMFATASKKRQSRKKLRRCCADDDFDCMELPDGGLRLCFPDGEIILTPKQRQILTAELFANWNQDAVYLLEGSPA